MSSKALPQSGVVVLLLHRRSGGGRSGRLGCALVFLSARVAGPTDSRGVNALSMSTAKITDDVWSVCAGMRCRRHRFSSLHVVFAACADSGLPRGPGCCTLMICQGLGIRGFRCIALCCVLSILSRSHACPLFFPVGIPNVVCGTPIDSARCIAGVAVRRCPLIKCTMLQMQGWSGVSDFANLQCTETYHGPQRGI